MSNIGENIRRLRDANGLTQEELARRMGYKSKSTINKIELGINDIPQSKIVKFAECLNTSPSALMGWVDQKTDKKNDDIVQVVKKLKKDPDFFEVVSILASLNSTEYESIKQILSALSKK